MALFGLYFTKNFLNQMGWPRKQGLLKKAVIDTTIFDGTIDQMVDWGAALGAGRPHLALQIIAHIFREKDWAGPDAPKLKLFIEEMRSKYKGRSTEPEDDAPHKILEPVHMTKHFGPSMKAEKLKDKQLHPILEQMFLEGLLYGLGNASRYEVWYKAYFKSYHEKLPQYQKMGLTVDKLPSLDENYADSEEIIRNYERDVDPLPSIPAKLFADAKALGLRI